MVKIEIMKTVTPEQKAPIIKSLALVGLLGIIILIAWLAIQLVNLFPSALTSLVSLANSVYNYNPARSVELDITYHRTIANHKEATTVRWNAPLINGHYTFSYECAEGVAVNIETKDKPSFPVNCNQPYDLGNINQLELTIESEKKRYTDISYEIAFFRPEVSSPAASAKASLTVVNPKIDAPSFATSTSSPAVITDTPQSTTTVAAKPSTTPPSQATTTPTRPSKPSSKEPEVIYTYGLPLSDPNGFTDLKLSLSGVGQILSNGVFVPTNQLKSGQQNVVQLTIHNLGTKTGDSWDVTLKLPNGTNYQSGAQAALKPNERSIISITFNETAAPGWYPLEANLNTTLDLHATNNSLRQNILVQI